MASERRSFSNQDLDLLQSLLETPTPSSTGAARRSPTMPHTSPASGDSIALLQALLNMPIAPSDERRPPVTLRSVEPQRYSKPARTGPTGFDILLHRSSQALSIGAVLVVGYWFVNVPLNNWLHPRPVPVVRALSLPPSPTRAVPTKTTGLVVNAATDVAQPLFQNNPTVQLLRATAVVSATSAKAQTAVPSTITAEARAAIPSATQPIAAQILSATLAIEAAPTDLPQPTAAPLMPSPTTEFMWPTMTPVQLGIVTKPSPVAVERNVVAAQPANSAQPRGANALPTRLIIPKLGLDVPIKEVFIVDNEWQVAEYAAGYLNGSGLPGVPGNLALDGHAGLYGAVFATLGSLNPGDEIFVDAAGVRYRYILRTASAFWPNQTEVLDSTETPTMTLITCTNWDTQRLVAQADFADASPAPDA